MATYTGDLLDKLRKQDLIPIVLSLQSKLEDKDKTVLEEVRKFNDSISKLHAELALTKNVNNLLLTRLSTLERQCWANTKYSMRECLDIVGITREVSREVLEEKVLNVFGKLGWDIFPDRIEAFHRAGRTNDTVIVKFSRRKGCQHVWSVKKDLKKLTKEDLELPGNSKLLININCAHITRCCGIKTRNFMDSVKCIDFLFLVTRSRSGSMKIVRRCR